MALRHTAEISYYVDQDARGVGVYPVTSTSNVLASLAGSVYRPAAVVGVMQLVA